VKKGNSGRDKQRKRSIGKEKKTKYICTKKMKDQIRLLRECVRNEIPAIVFQGDDSCTLEVLEAAHAIYAKHGATKEFLYDFQLLIDDVRAYQKENPMNVRLADLSKSETELVREDMQKKGLSL
jgi:hypothetical protein